MHEKEIEKLQAEKKKIERQLVQEQQGRTAQAGAPAYHPWCSHRERRTADKGFERKRILCFCRTGLCADRHAKIAHKNRQRSCGR